MQCVDLIKSTTYFYMIGLMKESLGIQSAQVAGFMAALFNISLHTLHAKLSLITPFQISHIKVFFHAFKHLACLWQVIA